MTNSNELIERLRAAEGQLNDEIANIENAWFGGQPDDAVSAILKAFVNPQGQSGRGGVR